MIRRHLGLVGYLVVVVALGAGLFRVETHARATHDALCSFKLNLVERAAATEEFILMHPDGIPGISRADLERSLKTQQQTIASLSDLDCEP